MKSCIAHGLGRRRCVGILVMLVRVEVIWLVLSLLEAAITT